jgi:two-component system, chemotaxis family, response regulator Rcp1
MRTVLLAEDSPSDVKLFQLACADAFGAGSRIQVVNDGEEALDYLRQRGEFRGVELPNLVILDLNMPRLGGLDVLAEMKKDDDLKSIPVIMLSSGGAESDINKAYSIGACCYVRKPMDFSTFEQTCRSIARFWMNTASLPVDA